MVLIRQRVRHCLLALLLLLGGCATYREPPHGTNHLAMSGAASNHQSSIGSHRATGSSQWPTLAGQYAFATIGEVVALPEADSSIDWSAVDMERIRQHLIDMERVTIDASVESRPVEGGARFVVRAAEP